MSGLSGNRAYLLTEEIYRADRDAEEAARQIGETHDELLARYSEIRKRSPAYEKLPRWACERLSTARQMRLHEFQRRDQTWVLLVRVDGTWAEKWDDLSESERIMFRSSPIGCNWEGGHFWTKARKPFNNPPGPAKDCRA